MLIYLGIIVAIVLVISYIFYFKPKRTLAWYKKNLEALGYKVYDVPFKMFDAPLMRQKKKDELEHGDAFYTDKHLLPEYDVAISNVLHMTTLKIFNADLLKEFYAH